MARERFSGLKDAALGAAFVGGLAVGSYAAVDAINVNDSTHLFRREDPTEVRRNLTKEDEDFIHFAEDVVAATTSGVIAITSVAIIASRKSRLE